MAFTPDFFTNNRRALRKTVPDGPIIIPNNTLMQMSADVAFPPRYDSGFYYLSGVHEPDTVLIIDGSKTTLVRPHIEKHVEQFDGSQSAADMQRVSGADDVLEHAAGQDYIRALAQKHGHINVLQAPPERMDVYRMHTNPARRMLEQLITQANPAASFNDIKKPLANLRAIKQPEELVAIKQAVQLTIDMYRAIGERVSSYQREHEIDADITHYAASRGYRMGYTTIVAAGERAAKLHAMPTNRKINGDPVLIDAGIEVDGYSADISRLLTDKKLPKRWQQVYDAVIDSKAFAEQTLKPGISIIDFEKQMDQHIGAHMKKLGIIKKITRENVRHYFPSMTSHFLGLDIHDAGDYHAPLAQNMVITIEPGIYIPEEGVGLRIEDNYVLTKNGLENLSQDLPDILPEG